MKKIATTKDQVHHPLGSVFNPHVVGDGYRVHFEYEPGNAFEVTLEKDGTLQIRTCGQHSDALSTHHHVANSCFLVARRWNTDLNRFMEFIRPGV